MNYSKPLLLAGFLLVTLIMSFSVTKHEYSFKEFIVKEPYPGGPVPLKPTSKWARQYRSRIAQEYKTKGMNFARHFSLVTWGCGTDCVSFAVVDATTGEVFDPPFEVLTLIDGKGHQFDGLGFRRYSELLVVSGCPNEGSDCGIRYYRWHNRQLERLK